LRELPRFRMCCSEATMLDCLTIPVARQYPQTSSLKMSPNIAPSGELASFVSYVFYGAMINEVPLDMWVQ